MKRKFFIRTLVISLSAMLLFGIASGFLIAFSAERLLKDDLLRLSDVIKDEAQRENAVLSNLVSFENSGTRAFRITFIDAAGGIVADSIRDSSDNHLSRPEVERALKGEPGFVKRYSETSKKNMMYYAVTFIYAESGDTYVLRVAIETSAMTSAVLSSLPFLVLLMAALVVALVITNQKYNSAMLLPLSEIKEKLHTINAGAFEKLSLDKGNEELLPVINELNEIVENISELNKIRSEFFANASHELHTPLTYIGGYAELMEKGLLTDADKIAECGAKIGEQTARMGGLIADMLKLSSLENAQGDAALSEVPLQKLLTAVTDAFRLQADGRNISIRTVCYEETVVSNEKLLKDILTNLIQNAVRYNRDNGSVDITVKRAEDRVVITVADTGIGIAQKDQSRVFERFFRVDKGRSRENGGTGLGLAIVKHSVQKLSGTVTLDSKIGRGSKFTVTLPADLRQKG
ncbi:MAG: hypothetical protein LBH24_03100 [Clostridiales bacterium]|jgi:two-component system phosphate regulon sensor histidine kinase PhoR|nr:hypothetical protein [Clostridiales bacterium]